MADDDDARSDARESTESATGASSSGSSTTRPRSTPRAGTRCVDAQPSATPFMRHRLPARAARIGERDRRRPAGRRTSSPLERGGELVAACPLYLKDHSYGEYVFDWAWADAYRRHGLRYYPKLLDAVPFTPVPGPRLLARDAEHARAAAARRSSSWRDRPGCRRRTCSSSTRPTRRRAREPAGCCAARCSSTGRNRAPAPYADFADFLASLQRDKRKKIQQERRRVADAGVTFDGRDAAPRSREADWDFFYRCYTLTYRAHHSTPYLTRDFFARMARDDGRATGCCSSPGAAASASPRR